jgi:hypothetical protein
MRKNAANGKCNDNTCNEARQYPLAAVVALTSTILELMQQVVSGTEIEDAHYARVFGNKEGVVQHLQRLCNVLSEIRAIDPEAPDASTAPLMMGAHDSEVLQHYVMQLAAHYAKEPLKREELGKPTPQTHISL